jgi:error-prone DNA polymerase
MTRSAVQGFHNPRMPWSELEAAVRAHHRHSQASCRHVDPLAVDADGGDRPAWSRKRQPYQAPR